MATSLLKSRAEIFIRAMYANLALGDEEHRRWLLEEMLKFVSLLEPLMKDDG